MDGVALHLQCTQREVRQRELAEVLAEVWADEVEAELANCRVQMRRTPNAAEC